MPDPNSTPAATNSNGRTAHERRRITRLVALALCAWFVAAYLLIPMIWELYFHEHRSVENVPGITHTTVGLAGDPINVALIGSKEDVERIMTKAGWTPADSLGLRSDVRIAADTVLDRAYQAAPVSSLYLYGRKEDLAFEKPVGGSPQHRNHVRFWKSPENDSDDRPMWVGSASYDQSVGLSHTTGEITHHIAPDVDTERDRLFGDLEQTHALAEKYVETGFHKTLSGQNGGGDPWRTDGDLWVGIISTAALNSGSTSGP